MNPEPNLNKSTRPIRRVTVSLDEHLYRVLMKYAGSLGGNQKPCRAAEMILYESLGKYATDPPSELIKHLTNVSDQIDGLLPLLPSVVGASNPSPAWLAALSSVCTGARELLQHADGDDLQQIPSLYHWLGTLIEDHEKAAKEGRSTSGASEQVAAHDEMARRYRLLRSLLRQFGFADAIIGWAAEARRHPYVQTETSDENKKKPRLAYKNAVPGKADPAGMASEIAGSETPAPSNGE